MAPRDPSGSFVGVDIGGTKVAAGLVNSGGQVSNRAREKMIGGEGPQAALACVKSAIAKVLDGAKTDPVTIRGIGVCAPGPLDPRTGVILNPPNLTCWREFRLGDELSREYNLPVKVDNDANAAALAEATWGAGVGYESVFYFTIGTGIGTGIVFDRQIYHGRTGAAAEGGHLSIDRNGTRCGCGKPGCIEALASGKAIERRARERLLAGQQSRLLELASGNPESITSEMVGQAHAHGDALATELLRETAELLAFWLGNIVDLIEPHVLIMGGGVGSTLKAYIPEIRQSLPKYSINSRCSEIPLLVARYGEEAGIAGGGALCLLSHEPATES